MWGAGTAVGTESGGDLGDLHPEQGSLHHHLAGKLHPGGAQVHPVVTFHGETPQSAVEVAGRAMKKEAPQGAKNGIAQVLVEEGHRLGSDSASESVAHDQVSA